MKRIIGRIVSFLCDFVPTANIICFSSFPDYSDNAYGMYRHMLKRGINKKFKLVWVVVDKSRLAEIDKQIKTDGSNIEVVRKYSLKAVWVYIRSRYVFETHGMFPALHLKQHADKHICLWHGMPLKKIGASYGEACSINCNYTVASSSLYQKIMAEAFAKPLDRVLVVGQPRCDLMYEDTDWFETVGIDRKKYNKIGIWMPTFRKSIVGEIREDGEFNDHAVSFLEESDMRHLDESLRENNMLLLLKIHPMDALQNSSFDCFSNIILIKPKDFHSQLYPLLGACDFLLTDYSSVFIDYQILRRPMGFVMNDIDSYNNTRGFYFDNIEKVLPGPIISTMEQFSSFINNLGVLDKGIVFNDFYDNCSAERICGFLGLDV